VKKILAVIGMVVFIGVIVGCSAEIGKPPQRSDDIRAVGEIVQNMSASRDDSADKVKQALLEQQAAQADQNREAILAAARIANSSNDSVIVAGIFIFVVVIAIITILSLAFISRGGTIYIPPRSSIRELPLDTPFGYLESPPQPPTLIREGQYSIVERGKK